MYNEAVKGFEEILTIEPENQNAKLYAGVCYVFEDNPIKGLEYLSELKDSDAAKNPLYSYWHGLAYYKNEKFDQAEIELNKPTIKQIPELQQKIADLKNSIKNAKDLKKIHTGIQVQNLGPRINSSEHEYGAFLSSDYTTLYYVREPNVVGQKLDNLEQPLFSRLNNDGISWSAPQILKFEVSETKVEVPIQLFDNDQKMLLYEDGNIAVSERSESGWSEPKPFVSALGSSKSQESHAFLFNNEKSIIYSSNSATGNDLNLYIIHFDEATRSWSSPKSISELNTLKNEDAPFVAKDGTLYFASEGFNSVGGYDIFKTKYDSALGKWETPQNMGFPVNSVYDDIFFIKTGPYGYFTSNRNGGYGLEDIYIAFLDNMTELKVSAKTKNGQSIAPYEIVANFDGKEYQMKCSQENCVIKLPINSKGKIKIIKNKKLIHEQEINTKIPLNGKGIATIQIALESDLEGIAQDKEINVVGKILQTPVGTEVNIIDLNTGKTVASTKIQKGGNFKINSVKYNNQSNYQITAISKGVVIAKNSISAANIKNGQTIDLGEIEQLKSVEVGSEIMTEKIYFDFNSFVIREVSYPVLDMIVAYLQENKTLKIEIAGHTDSIGKDEYNQYLSEMRAKSVFNYLASKGIAKARLKAVGYGEKKPLASNDDEQDGRELNRRIEFTVLEK